ncbi:CAP domain-containing protein [Patescibacteria group bacterium]|nr:CAP domain-containing protein [Patescibacteria group bacterium]
MKRKKNKKGIFDADKDGLNDYEEKYIYGTDPYNPDTDLDGMSDGKEVKKGRNPKGPGMLKDLFIPHAGNDYKPQALHPRRLFFHALSLVLIKFLIFGAVISFPVVAWLTPDLLLEQSKKIIELTNKIRQGLGITLLEEDNLLNQAAYQKTEDMLVDQYFAHVSPSGRQLANWLRAVNYNYKTAGENLAIGFASAEEVVTAWTKSETHYANIIDSDFSEIGVGMTSGNYNNYETTLVAQFFGKPREDNVQNIPPVADNITETTEESLPTTAEPVPEFQILGERESVAKDEDLESEIKEGPQVIDMQNTKIVVVQPEGQKEDVVKATAYLSENTVTAEIFINDYRLELKPDEKESNKWTGQLIVFDQERDKIFNPIILPVLILKDSAGNQTQTDIQWENITPLKPSLLSQYFFVKSHQSKYTKGLFSVSGWYYRFILLIALIALFLNIFIKIKKQHPHLILSTLGFIGLLIILITI